ncbi:hypothetical protein AMTR_s00049p00210820 [Amborella trichopoda]|uniref:Uncharacterized protein n=1 Tax=Amborella trichopoda TaxID=13333 RepID=W1PUW2_AMBTC|nr:hypothetical protein AMTR_s00049p00210820 [Amborella trichopoda]
MSNSWNSYIVCFSLKPPTTASPALSNGRCVSLVETVGMGMGMGMGMGVVVGRERKDKFLRFHVEDDHCVQFEGFKEDPNAEILHWLHSASSWGKSLTICDRFEFVILMNMGLEVKFRVNGGRAQQKLSTRTLSHENTFSVTS